MNPDAYRLMAQTEQTHWWYVGRRAIIRKVLETLDLPGGADILEIGAGTGGNLDLLREFGVVTAVEHDDYAREVAACKTGLILQKGRLPNDLTYPDSAFDLICLFDVLEHVHDDRAALSKLRPLLKRGGRVMLTVPAYGWLWSLHDVELHHYRRYNLKQLSLVSAGSGFRVAKSSYFNTSLFLPALLARLFDRIVSPRVVTGTRVPAAWINSLFTRLLMTEALLIKHLGLPFGLSIIVVLEPD